MADDTADLTRGDSPAAKQSVGDPLRDDWDAPPPGTPVLHLDGFVGPMDLLLELAERRRIDLHGMSPLAMVEQFVAELQRLTNRVPLERRADWLVLATRLVLLRSRLVFPATPQAAADAERDAANELRDLNEFAAMWAAVHWFEARPQLGWDVFTRPKARDPRTESYMALMEACLVVLRGRRGQSADVPTYSPPVTALWRVVDALARIRQLLAHMPDGSDIKAFLPKIADNEANREIKAKAAVASTLVAAFEMPRARELTLTQLDPHRTCTFPLPAA